LGVYEEDRDERGCIGRVDAVLQKVTPVLIDVFLFGVGRLFH
jgi:hypothetical protein